MSSSILSKNIFLRFARFWRDSQHQACDDIRKKWRRGAFCFLLATIMAFPGLLYSDARSSFRSPSRWSACSPDGSFRIDPENFAYWSMSGFFQINIAFGVLSFTQAKTIDVIWDVLFGRGGQGLLTYITWKVFANYFTVSMATRPITLRTYRNIFVQDQSSLIAIGRMLRDLSFRLGLQSRVGTTFIIFAMTFVLAFPTLASAMTGYNGHVKSFVPDKNGNFLDFSSFGFLFYIIHDGWRIGKTVDSPVSFQVHGADAVISSFSILERPWCDYIGYAQDKGSKEECYMLKNVSSYVFNYGLFGQTNTSSVFRGQDLPAPVLNISAFYLQPYLFGPDKSRETFFRNKTQIAWTSSNQTYDLEYVKSRGTCQAIETYQWGFSFLQLNLMLLLLLIWSVGISIMWLDSHLTIKQEARTDVAGEYKAILELADAMYDQSEPLGTFSGGDNISILTESQLQQRFSRDLRGGAILYSKTPSSCSEKAQTKTNKWGVWPWARREKWWLVSLFLLVGGSISMGYFYILPYGWTIGMAAAIPITVTVGVTGKSRGMLYFWLFWVLTVIPMLISWAVILGRR